MNREQSDFTGTTTIIRRVQEDGSEESWERFVRRYQHVVVHYARESGLRDDQAEEIRQVVLMELTRLLPDLTLDPARGSFRSLLRTIVKRRSIDLLRTLYRDAERLEKHTPRSNPDDEEIWERSWREGLMKQALREVAERVSPDTYQAFELTSMHGVPAREVAKMLGVSVENVYQARKRVSHAVKQEYDRLINEADSPDN